MTTVSSPNPKNPNFFFPFMAQHHHSPTAPHHIPPDSDSGPDDPSSSSSFPPQFHPHNPTQDPTQSSAIYHLSFNQDNGCFAAGLGNGFRIYNTDPFKPLFRRDLDSRGGIGLVAMLFRCNILCLVGGGPDPIYPMTKVMIWDDHQSRCIGELSFRSEVKNVKLRRDSIVVVLLQKIFVYNFADLKLMHQIETVLNPKGLCEISHTSSPMVLVCPGLQKGQIRVENYGSKRTKFVMAHDSRIACMTMTQDGRLLATASSKGTLIRVFNAMDGSLLQEEKMESDLGKLFIGGISWDTDEERLKEYFSKYGEVVEAVIMRDRTTGRARGFGFVVFADPAVAERVIMDKHMIDGRTVEAKKAVPRDDQHILNRNTSSINASLGPGRTKKIFVGGLASTVTDSDFKKYFEQFGNITDVVVMYDHNTQRPRGFGFITYDSEDAVDRVLHKTFHELNGKMVEVKRAVPKELSPGPSRSPLIGYNYSLSRTNNFLNAYAQGYNMSSVRGFGMRMDSRFSPLASGRSGFPPFGTTGYGMGMNLEPGLSPSYGGGSNFGNSPGYGRILSPYYSGNSNRYSTPIGYGVGNARNDSVLSPTTRNLWANGGLNTAASPPSPGAFLGSGSGSFGASFGNSGANWGPSHVSAQGGGSASGYTSGSMGYGSGGDSSYGLGGGGYGRSSGTAAAPNSSFAGSTGVYEGSYGDLYRSGSAYGDSTWGPGTPELDGVGSFGYGLGNIASDVTTKSSEGYIGSYGVTSRQSNRGIAT